MSGSSLPVRVRFAPSPTGVMHLGNVRAALMNYLFARQKKGTFILRIEDTDEQRAMERGVERILEFLDWLDLTVDEGPYFQSKRNEVYGRYLELLQQKKVVYRCFCTAQELEKRRERQIALKLPPRYDRLCMGLSVQENEERLRSGTPFIWRVALDHGMTVVINDMAHGEVTFELKNFSDFPVTRQDGSFTFLFANFVDDVEMRISHVVRGEDHLTNTACQAFLYTILGHPLPIFWHLPILCNAQGAKLSKRDFGFSLQDLIDGGFLPEAILNYLAISGGGSFEQEIMSVEELSAQFDFTKIHSTGHVRYDVDRLRWFNHKWIVRLSINEIAHRAVPFCHKEGWNVTQEQLVQLLPFVLSDITTLTDVPKVLEWYFKEPTITQATLHESIASEWYQPLVNAVQEIQEKGTATTMLEVIKQVGATYKIPVKTLFSFIRIACTGSAKGISIGDIVALLSVDQFKHRLAQACWVISSAE